MISWIGGKSRISSWIIPFIPKNIKTYSEPFGGAFWVYLKMNLDDYPNLTTIVYNDFNEYLVNMFMCCKEHEKFYEYLKDYKSQNKELFYKFQNDLFKNKIDYVMPDFENAMKFSYLTSQVWSGISPADGKYIDLKGKYKSKFDTFRDKLKNEKYIKNLEKITNFENLDFQKVIEKYDNDDAFFYVDAPYVLKKLEDSGGEKYYSEHDFTNKDHERLAICLKNIKGKFAMSYYYFEELEKWFPKDKYNWHMKVFAKASMAQSGKEQTKGEELLIMNY